MNAIQRIMAAMSAICLFAAPVVSGAEQATLTNQVATLLKDLQRPEQLARCKDLVIPKETNPILTEAGKEIELKRAREAIARAKVIIPQLRKAIKPGTSVFDYPGLLARGSISYDEYSRKYECYFGVYLRREEGCEPYDFRITIDEKGLIKEVMDVIWKE